MTKDDTYCIVDPQETLFGTVSHNYFFEEGRRMSQEQFLNALFGMTKAYRWSYEGNRVLGVARNGADRGRTFNPITAMARTMRVGTFGNSRRETQRAARLLGLTPATATAILSVSNRGNAQVVRGRVLETLGL